LIGLADQRPRHGLLADAQHLRAVAHRSGHGIGKVALAPKDGFALAQNVLLDEPQTALSGLGRGLIPISLDGPFGQGDAVYVTFGDQPAQVLSLNGILAPDGKLDKGTLPKVEMPNRDGFIPDPEFSKAPVPK
jgi:hypothetical protein